MVHIEAQLSDFQHGAVSGRSGWDSGVLGAPKICTGVESAGWHRSYQEAVQQLIVRLLVTSFLQFQWLRTQNARPCLQQQ